jgi:hypothetical protein
MTDQDVAFKAITQLVCASESGDKELKILTEALDVAPAVLSGNEKIFASIAKQ